MATIVSWPLEETIISLVIHESPSRISVGDGLKTVPYRRPWVNS
jgi:hypothetical protein